MKSKNINYNNNLLFAWNCCNVGVQEDRNANIVPVKNSSPKYRIDGFMSALDAYVGLCDHYQEYLKTVQYKK